MTKYLFHLCPSDLRDDALYPLNALRARYPDLYTREHLKWAGRESVLEFEVPHLGVRWGDTVNLSALDPNLLVATRTRLGLSLSRLLERHLVRIPLERLAGLDAVQYVASSHGANSRPGDPEANDLPAPADFSPFVPDEYEELHQVPSRHLTYLQEQRDRGQPALGFVFVPHVLVRGEVDICGLAREPLTGATRGRT